MMRIWKRRTVTMMAPLLEVGKRGTGGICDVLREDEEKEDT